MFNINKKSAIIRIPKYLWQDYWKNLDLLCKISKRRRLYLALDMLWCIVFRLTLPTEYCDFGYDFIPRSKRKDYFTLAKRKRARETLSTHRSRNITANKFYFASVMKLFFGRKFLLNTTMTPEEFQVLIEGEEKIIYKPLASSAGRGQIVYHLDGSRSTEALYNEIKSLRRGILESWIVQHEALNALYPDAVHIVRLHTLHKGKGKDLILFGANLSFAVSGEISNGCLDTTLSALVDEKTGRVLTEAIDLNYNSYLESPQTHVSIPGFQLPDWEKALDICRRAALCIPEIRLIGWDIAFTPDGPILVEGNGLPTCDFMQYRCWVESGLTRGIWPLIKEYL